MRFSIICLGLLVSTVSMGAQPQFAGDLDQNGVFNAPDVVLITNTLPSAEALSGIDAVLADANQDGTVTADDISRDVEIILGLDNPLPLNGGDFTGAPITFWSQPLPPPISDANAGFLPAVSFNASPE